MNGSGGSDPGDVGDVSIVGSGQVGTMIGLALARAAAKPRRDVGTVTVYDRDPAVRDDALARGAGTAAGTDLAEAFRTDTIVLAVPVDQIVSMVDAFGPATADGALLIDTGSAKSAVIDAMRRSVPGRAHAVGGHPMAGTERAGPAGAEPERLFGATFVLTPAREDATGLARAEAFVRAVGARPVVMDAAEHDRLVALTSHLPHLLAYALVASAAGGRPDASPREHAEAPTDQALRDLISTGFLGATRLAESDPSSVAAFLSANAPATARAAGLFADSLDALVDLLEDAAGLESALRAARDDRRRLTGEAGP